MTRKRWGLAAVVLVVAATTGAAVVLSSASHATDTAHQPLPNTAAVERGTLAERISQYGTLTYRARPDGSPFSVINQARGTYTELPAPGDTIECGEVLYRVDDHPVLLLCGSTPAYRSLSSGTTGRDVAELNADLVSLGYATRTQLGSSSASFGVATATALAKLQSRRGLDPTGSLDLGQAVFLPESARISTVTGVLGSSTQPGAQVLSATSDTPEVRVDLEPSQQNEVKRGDGAQIILPSNTSITGTVERLGTVAQVPTEQNGNLGSTTVPLYISIDQPDKTRGLDQAPVQVAITTADVANALSVPVTAIVATSGGGYAVEAVRASGTRELVAVRLGLFDNVAGRVQVDGDLHEGDDVVVPSS